MGSGRSKEIKTSTDLHQGRQIWTEKKKWNDIRKALGRDRRFSRPLKTEELSKKSTSGSLKMGGGGTAKKRP